MGAASRRKGVTGERELRGKWEAGGWTLRGLEADGDFLASKQLLLPGGGYRMAWAHLEGKREEHFRRIWMAQCEAEAPAGVPPVLCWRRNGERWYAALPLDDLLELIG